MNSSKFWSKLALLVVAAILITGSGCGENEFSGDENGLSVELILAAVEASGEEVKTCRYDMTMKASGLSSDTSLKGAMDLENKRAKFEMEMTVCDTSVETEYYMLNDTMYLKLPAEGGGYEWVKAILPDGEEYWETANPVDEQLCLLEEALQWEKVGVDNVRGVACYVLEIVPDMSELWEAMDQDEVFPEDQLMDMSMRFWVAKDTFLFMKMYMSIGVEGLDSDIEWEMVVYDYGKPVSIELPPEAESATEIDPDEMEL